MMWHDVMKYAFDVVASVFCLVMFVRDLVQYVRARSEYSVWTLVVKWVVTLSVLAGLMWWERAGLW